MIGNLKDILQLSWFVLLTFKCISFRVSQLHITWWENNSYLALSWRNSYAQSWHLNRLSRYSYTILHTKYLKCSLKALIKGNDGYVARKVVLSSLHLGWSGNREDAGHPTLHPKTFPNRRIPIHYRDQLLILIYDLLNQGIIYPSTSPRASPVTVVKNDGRLSPSLHWLPATDRKKIERESRT